MRKQQKKILIIIIFIFSISLILGTYTNMSFSLDEQIQLLGVSSEKNNSYTLMFNDKTEKTFATLLLIYKIDYEQGTLILVQTENPQTFSWTVEIPDIDFSAVYLLNVSNYYDDYTSYFNKQYIIKNSVVVPLTNELTGIKI